MSSNKKGSLVMTFLIGTLAVILVAYLLIPAVKQTNTPYPDSFRFSKASNSSVIENITLYAPLDNSTLRIEETNGSRSLNTGSNYTLLDATSTGIVELTNVDTGDYTAYYSIYLPSYSSSSGERALWAVVILAGVIGVLYWLLTATGIIGKD